jgi:hypothetical protein
VKPRKTKITVYEEVVARIRSRGPGFVFSAKDFSDLGSRGSVDVALSKATADGLIRRIARGLYDFPKRGELLGGLLAPDFDAVARAIARKTGMRIQPSGAVAANLLGLSEQVPAKIVYLTSGTSRSVSAGGQTITFVHARDRDLLSDPTSAAVVQALRFLGREGITDTIIAKLARSLTSAQKRRLSKDARYASDWVADVVRRVVSRDEE